MNEINNTQIDNTKDLDVALPINHFMKYSDNYSKKSWSLSLFYRDEPALNNVGDFADNNTTDSFISKEKQTNMSNRWQWHEECWNNAATEMFE